MERGRCWLAGCMVLLMAGPGALQAQPNVSWTHDLLISSEAGDHAKLHAVTVGQVDIAWQEEVVPGGNGCDYSQILHGELAVDEEQVVPDQAGSILGIGRHDGSVRVAVVVSRPEGPSLQELTRSVEGRWTGLVVGSLPVGIGPNGGYAVDPTTGLGGFIFKDPNTDIVYLHETAENVWESSVLEADSIGQEYGVFSDLVYNPAGDPIAGYTYNEYLRAGKIDGPGSLNDVAAAYSGLAHIEVAVVSDSNVYLLDGSYGFRLHRSTDGGETWTLLGGAATGSLLARWGMDTALAVAPDESMAAVLSWAKPDDPNPLLTTLWISEPNEATGQPLGAEWYTDPCWLPGAGNLSRPDVTFDPYGYLYVAYYRYDAEPSNAGMHLLSNMPPWADSDVDGVHDEVDLCPGSDPNEYAIDFYGCKVPPVCGDAWHPISPGDRNGDCYVNTVDLIPMAQQWLDCVHPLDADCMQLQPTPQDMYPDTMYMSQCWPKTVDGLLGDWVDPCWVDVDLIYAGDPNDIASAKYSVCWDPCEDKLYSAIVVEDTDHVFESAPTDWNSCDRAEIYVQADPNGGDQWGSTADATYDKAQQYIVGYQGILPGWTWAVFGHGTYLPGAFEPKNAHFTYDGGTRVNGDTITYEVSAKAWQWYGGNTPEVDPNVVRQLEPGIQVGFDVAVGSHWGTTDPCDAAAYAAEYGMLSANPITQKYIYAENFQRWELLDYDGSVVIPECGDWGYLELDTDVDCYIGLSDFAAWSVYWLDCTNPDPPCSYKP